jgi:hypothetical protein
METYAHGLDQWSGVFWEDTGSISAQYKHLYMKIMSVSVGSGCFLCVTCIYLQKNI